eukprot:2899074-Amphidinium_carterae.6
MVLQKPQAGSMVLPNIIPTLMTLQERASVAQDSELDEVALQVACFYQEAGKFGMASGVMMEKLMCASAPVVQSRTTKLACLVWLYQCMQRDVLEASLAKAFAPECLLYYLDCVVFDETPLKLTIHDVTGGELVAMLVEDKVAGLEGAFVSAMTVEKGQALVCKVLQTHATSAYLLKTAAGLVGITLPLETPLQSMERNNGACLANCMTRLSGVTGAASSFQMRVRGVTCDAAGANFTGESLVNSVRGPSWGTHYVCL